MEVKIEALLKVIIYTCIAIVTDSFLIAETVDVDAVSCAHVTEDVATNTAMMLRESVWRGKKLGRDLVKPRSFFLKKGTPFSW